MNQYILFPGKTNFIHICAGPLNKASHTTACTPPTRRKMTLTFFSKHLFSVVANAGRTFILDLTKNSCLLNFWDHKAHVWTNRTDFFFSEGLKYITQSWSFTFLLYQLLLKQDSLLSLFMSLTPFFKFFAKSNWKGDIDSNFQLPRVRELGIAPNAFMFWTISFLWGSFSVYKSLPSHVVPLGRRWTFPVSKIGKRPLMVLKHLHLQWKIHEPENLLEGPDKIGSHDDLDIPARKCASQHTGCVQ